MRMALLKATAAETVAILFQAVVSLGFSVRI